MFEIKENFYSLMAKDQIKKLVVKQLQNFFFFDVSEDEILENYFDSVISRCDVCFQSVDNKYFKINGSVYFSPYHSGQWLIFLYYLSNECSKNNAKQLADKIYYLNKIMHGCDIYHEVELPDSFFFEHPVGSVFGRAKYGNCFFAMQGCTIGGNKGIYPVIGVNVKMLSGSKVLGNSNIGDNVTLAASTYVKDTDIPANATVFGMSPNLTIKFL